MFVRLVANSLGLLAAAWIVPGITLLPTGSRTDQVIAIAVTALVFGLVNSLVKPLLTVISLPAVVLTLGLFLLVINGLMLQLTAWISKQFDLGLVVDGWWSAVFGAIIISIVSGITAGVLSRD